MAAANVRLRFAAAGDAVESFSFDCPLRPGRACADLRVRGSGVGGPSWAFDGNIQEPSFEPSINCGHCGWHGYIVADRTVGTDRKTEA